MQQLFAEMHRSSSLLAYAAGKLINQTILHHVEEPTGGSYRQCQDSHSVISWNLPNKDVKDKRLYS